MTLDPQAPDASERRKPGGRVPFEALVEIAAPEGSSFEAESVNLSTTGMHLRTAYLPKVGTPLDFRFEATDGGEPIVVNGEVVWSQDGEGGCEFGVRFSDLGGRDAEAIRRIVTITSETSRPGAPVRIHIDGLQAPMKATLRDELPAGSIVGTELKMLRLGAVVELESKDRDGRRAARVDGVSCEIDPHTRVPQLVIKLQYPQDVADAAADRELPFLTTKKVPMPADVENAAHEVKSATLPPPPMQAARDTQPTDAAPRVEQARVALPVAAEPEGRLDAMKDGMRTIGDKMKDAFGGAATAASRLGARVGTTVALLAKRKGEPAGDEAEARRTTAKLGGQGTKRTLRPQGASRDFMTDGRDEEVAMQEIDSKKVARRRQVGIAAGVGIALVLGFLAFRKPVKQEPIVQAPAPALEPMAAPVAPVPAPVPPPSADPALAAVATPPPPALVGETTGLDAKGNPNPFGTPSVKKGTKMVLKLDGPVTEIRGMQMPNGFVVSVPNRKSLEAAGPLAAKDPRIGSAKVVNQPAGAELTIAFKDGATTPTYVVKAKGDAIEIVLASEKAIAKKGKTKGQVPAKTTTVKKKK